MSKHCIDKLADRIRNMDLKSVPLKRAYNVGLFVICLLVIFFCYKLHDFGYYSNRHERRLLLLVMGICTALSIFAMIAQCSLYADLRALKKLLKIREEQRKVLQGESEEKE